MNNPLLRPVILWGALIGCLNLPSTGDAGPLCDWLFRRHQYAQPVVANYPQPVVANYPPAGGCGAAYCEQTVVRYVPQVAYRTVWQPVPVTSYRRTSYCNPATGLPMTCVQPCTSYTYQARQVPYTTYRPVYSTVPVTVNSGWLASYAPAPACANRSSGFLSQPAISSPSYSTTYDSQFESTIPPSSSAGAYTNDTPPGATPWERVEPTPVSPSDRYPDTDIDSQEDPGSRRPQIQRNSYSPSVRRIPSIGRRPDSVSAQDPYYVHDRTSRDDDSRRTLADSSLSDSWQRFDSDANRFDRDLVDLKSDSRRRQISPEGASRPSQARRLLDIHPVPNVDPPLNERRDLPDLLNESVDREAHGAPARPVLVRWASHRIAWNEVQDPPINRSR
jgi:hypothetical protein